VAVLLVSWGAPALVAAVVAEHRLFAGARASTDGAPGTRRRPLRGLQAMRHHHVAQVAATFPAMVLPMVVALRLGTAEAAYFNTAWMLGGACFMISPAIAAALLADAGHEPGRIDQRLRLAARLVLVLLAASGLGLIALGPAVLGLFGPAYRSGYGLLLLLVASTAPDAVTNLAVTVWRAADRLRVTTALNVTIAAVALAATWMLCPVLGIAGAGWAWLAAQSAGTVLVAIDGWRRR
jgi:O-antigen/teichoic acid export membrane protein